MSPGAQPGAQVCKKKNSSFLLENSFFGVHTGPGAQPGVQVCNKSSSFLLENSIFWVQTGPGAQPGHLLPNRARCPARGPGLY